MQVTKDLVKKIAELRADGLTYRQVDDELGLVHDPYNSRVSLPTESYRLVKRAAAKQLIAELGLVM